MSTNQPVGPTYYKMRQRLFSIGEDFEIENAHGEAVFRIDGKVMRIRETFVLEDAQGRELLTIQAKLLALRDSMTISRGGDTIATIRKAWLTPFETSLKSTSQTARIWSLRAISSITSMRSAEAHSPWLGYRSVGSRLLIPMGSR